MRASVWALMMFHPNTQRLIETWRAHRGDAPLPSRSALSPIDLGTILPQIFMLGRDDSELVVRLCGTLVADLYGHDLRGEQFLSLWTKEERPLVLNAIARSIGLSAPVILTADAFARTGEGVGVEICLAPLTGPGGATNRTLGLFQPISMLSRLMGQPICRLSLRGALFSEDRKPSTPLKLVAVNGLRVA